MDVGGAIERLGAKLAEKVDGAQAVDLLEYGFELLALAYIAPRLIPPVLQCCRQWSRDRQELDMQRRGLEKKVRRSQTRLERKKAGERSEGDDN